MSVELGLMVAVGLVAVIGFALLAGSICHFGRLEQDPIEWWRY